MNRAQGAVTGIDLIDDDSETKDIHDVAERLSLSLHLRIN